MDTDELSIESYKGIIITAENFNHDLTLRFGVLASSCEDEKEYLLKATQLIKAIKRLDKSNLSNIFFDEIPDKQKLHSALDKILENISAIELIPEDKRHYDSFD